MKNFKVYKFTIGILCIIAFTAINFNLNMKHKRTSLLEHIEQFGDRGTLRIPLPSRVEELLPEGDILTDELVFSIKKNINDVVSDLTKRLEKKELNWRLFRIYLIDIDYDIFKLRKQIRKGKKKPYLIDEVVKHLIEQLKNNKELFTDDFFGSAPTEAFTEFLGLTGVEA
ncbi:MAG: hypothetical protein KKD11_08285, partial [Candidatus Omnitrophica bacterium]|nr:hypothetical protein [Candidatus Omnitrophota bacterium]